MKKKATNVQVAWHSIGSLRSCDENVSLKLNFALSLLRIFHVGRVVKKIGEVHFRLLGTNGFQVKAENERFTVTSSRCRQNLKYENFTSLFGRLRQNIAPKSVPHVQHDYIFSFNQSNHWFVALSLRLTSSNLELPNELNSSVVMCNAVTKFARKISQRITDFSVLPIKKFRPTWKPRPSKGLLSYNRSRGFVVDVKVSRGIFKNVRSFPNKISACKKEITLQSTLEIFSSN